MRKILTGFIFASGREVHPDDQAGDEDVQGPEPRHVHHGRRLPLLEC